MNLRVQHTTTYRYLNAGITATVAYRMRDEEGTQAPLEPLCVGSGSCRDIAALFIAAVRHLGFGARAVSSYLFDPDVSSVGGGPPTPWSKSTGLAQDGSRSIRRTSGSAPPT